MKVRISHFSTKNIKINEVTKPKIRSVSKISVSEIKRQPLSTNNIRVSLSNKLGVNSQFKKIKPIHTGKVQTKNSVKPIKKEICATKLERQFYKENSRYAYTPEQHHQLSKIHHLEKIANNPSKW